MKSILLCSSLHSLSLSLYLYSVLRMNGGGGGGGVKIRVYSISFTLFWLKKNVTKFLFMIYLFHSSFRHRPSSHYKLERGEIVFNIHRYILCYRSSCAIPADDASILDKNNLNNEMKWKENTITNKIIIEQHEADGHGQWLLFKEGLHFILVLSCP